MSEGKLPSDFCILYRTNAQSMEFESYLIALGIPYVIKNGIPFFMRREVADLHAYLKAAHKDDLKSLLRIGNIAPKGYHDDTLNLASTFWDRVIDRYKYLPKVPLHTHMVEVASRMHDAQITGVHTLLGLLDKIGACNDVRTAIDLTRELVYDSYMEREFGPPKEDDYHHENIEKMYTVAELFPEVDKFMSHIDKLNRLRKPTTNKARQALPAVNLMSIHASKGLEFPVVFLAGCLEGVLPHRKGDFPEESRLFYVGVTRARRQLIISAPVEAKNRGKVIPVSRFVAMVGIKIPEQTT